MYLQVSLIIQFQVGTVRVLVDEELIVECPPNSEEFIIRLSNDVEGDGIEYICGILGVNMGCMLQLSF